MARKKGYLDVGEHIRGRSASCRLAEAAGGSCQLRSGRLTPQRKWQRLILGGAFTMC